MSNHDARHVLPSANGSSRHRIRIYSTYNVTGIPVEPGATRPRSADFEIVGRFSGRPLSSEVTLQGPHTKL